MMKLKNSNCDQTKKNANCDKTKKKSNCDETQKQLVMKHKNLNFNETQKLKLWWN